MELQAALRRKYGMGDTYESNRKINDSPPKSVYYCYKD